MKSVNNAPGKALLRVVGILYIIGGCLGIFLALMINILPFTSLPSNMNYAENLFIAIITSGLQIYVGFMGAVNANKPEKCRLLFILGLILFIIPIASIIISVIYRFGRISFALIFGFILPFLFVSVASENKNAA